QSLLRDYAKVVDAYQQFVNEDEADELAQLTHEMETMLFRIGNNLDYFGNPAGYAPMLSLASSLTLYESEIDAAIDILYLTHWPVRVAEETSDQIAGIQTARSKMESNSVQNQQLFTKAVSDLSNLDAAVDSIMNQMEAHQTTIQILQDQAEREAERLAEE